MQKIRFLPLLCVLLMLFTAPTLLAQQEPDTPYPAETMLSVRMMPPGERSLRNFLYPKLMAQEGSIQLPAGTSYNLLVQTLDNMRNDYPELFHIDSYRVHYQRNQPDVAQSISPRYLCSTEEASALRKQLLETAQSWVDENPDPLALYERLVPIHPTACGSTRPWALCCMAKPPAQDMRRRFHCSIDLRAFHAQPSSAKRQTQAAKPVCTHGM